MATVIQGNAHHCPSPQGLEAIARGDINLAIWERDPPQDFAPLLDRQPEDVRFAAPLAQIETQSLRKLEKAGFPDIPQGAALARDIAELAELYAGLFQLRDVEVRIETVTTDSCRKFHADYVQARLITTYVGRGTDWLDNDDAARVRQGEEPRRIHSLTAGDVGLFKGKLGTPTPAIHRSPPIAGTGETRLLVVLNSVEER